LPKYFVPHDTSDVMLDDAMKSMIRHVDDHGHHYEALMFWCPGCENERGNGGLHMLPISGDSNGRDMWSFDGNLEAPTLTPSILTGRGTEKICHSFLTAGVFHFLGDCTHALANQQVPIPDLPDWVTHS